MSIFQVLFSTDYSSAMVIRATPKSKYDKENSDAASRTHTPKATREINGFACEERDTAPRTYLRGTHWIFSNYIEVRIGNGRCSCTDMIISE